MAAIKTKAWMVALVGLFLWLGSATEALYSQSLADCKAVAAKFDNTCGGTDSANAWTSVADATETETHSCSSSIVETCVDGGTTSDGKCSWKRKMCATCRESDGKVYIRIQSNGLPNRCYVSPKDSLKDQDYDFEALFNGKVVSDNVELDSESAVNGKLCDINAATKTVPSSSSYSVKGTGKGMNTLAGIGLSGVPYFNSLSIENVDPFFPTEGDAEKLDTCASHPQVAGAYHYHSASICEVNAGTKGQSVCDKDSSCSSNIISYVMDGFDKTTPQVIGLAKDGHIIYSPKYVDGAISSSDGDLCNGYSETEGDNTQYSYYASDKFPYILGCYGPAKKTTFRPTCTTNGLASSSASAVQATGILVAMIVMIVAAIQM